MLRNWRRRRRQRELYEACRLILQHRGEEVIIPARVSEKGIPYPAFHHMQYQRETFWIENIGLVFPIIVVFCTGGVGKGKIVFRHDPDRCERHNPGPWEDEILALEQQVRQELRWEHEARFEPIEKPEQEKSETGVFGEQLIERARRMGGCR